MQTTTTPTETRYPRLPEMAPRHQDETAEAYGLRAFGFVLATDTTATLDDEALRLATHTYRLTIGNRDLLPAVVDRLAEVDRQINATIRRRAAQMPAVSPSACPRTDDRPNVGPMAPLSPTPTPRPPQPTYAQTPTPAQTHTQPLTRADFAF